MCRPMNLFGSSCFRVGGGTHNNLGALCPLSLFSMLPDQQPGRGEKVGTKPGGSRRETREYE